MRDTADESFAAYEQVPARPDRSVDWRRLLVFAGGGLVLLLLMLSISNRMRDRAELAAIGLNQDTPFSAWVGDWNGSIQTSDTDGNVVAHETVTRRFGPFDGLTQSVVWSEARASGPAVDRHGTQEYDQRVLLRSVAGDSGPETYAGRVDVGGTITWTRESDKHLTLIREWIDDSTYYIEGFTVNKGQREAVVYHSGRLRRVGSSQTGTR